MGKWVARPGENCDHQAIPYALCSLYSARLLPRLLPLDCPGDDTPSDDAPYADRSSLPALPP
eukprot:scaffold4283_cov220-Pinguiococcus_pyrenoidosus.AAC.4